MDGKEEILEDLINEGTPTRVNDENLENTFMNSVRTDPGYAVRNDMYSALLEMYVHKYDKKEKGKRIYKLVFFVVIMLIFVAVIGLCSFVAVYTIIKNEGITVADAGALIGSVAGIISTIIIIPKIIAEYLFPLNEESNMIDLVKSMQLNDANIMKILNNHENDV